MGDFEGLYWHYTDAYGFHGIVSNGHLFASELHYLNDSSEFEYAFDALRQAVDDLQRELPIEVHQALRNSLQYAGAADGVLNTFVACFCEASDLLSQWRSYGQQGYAIGFDFDATQRPTREPENHLNYRPVRVSYGKHSGPGLTCGFAV